MFYQGGKIDNSTHVPGPVDQQNFESEYNEAFTTGMALTHFGIIMNELLNKDPDLVTEQEPLIILDSKKDFCMDKNGKYIKPTRNISRRFHFVRNGKEYNLHKPVWCEVGLKLAEIGTNNIREG